MPKIMTLHHPDPTDDLSDDEWDAEVLLNWVRWRFRHASASDTSMPPPSAWHDVERYPHVGANPHAWRIMLRNPEFEAIGVSVAETLALVPDAPAVVDID